MIRREDGEHRKGVMKGVIMERDGGMGKGCSLGGSEALTAPRVK